MDELLEAPLGHKSSDSWWEMDVKQRSRERTSPSAHAWLLVGEEEVTSGKEVMGS